MNLILIIKFLKRETINKQKKIKSLIFGVDIKSTPNFLSIKEKQK